LEEAIMNLEVKAVHFEPSDSVKEMIDKKLKRIRFASDYIVDQLFTLTYSKNGYACESTTNFRWGKSAHIKVESTRLREGLDILFDKLEMKVSKEKEKIQDRGA
jgi:ribosome hibernation promoting factor